MLNFIKEVLAELRMVTFPTRKDVIRLTAVVITISFVVGIFIGASDFLFTKLLELVVN